MGSDELRMLYRYLDERFVMGDVEELCYTLGVDCDNIPGEETKLSKLRELQEYLRRRGRLDELVPAVAELRPDIDLSAFGGPPARKRMPTGVPWASRDTTGIPAGQESLTQTTVPRPERTYQNFDIHVRGSAGNYTVECESDEGQSPSVPRSTPLTDEESQRWLAQMAAAELGHQDAKRLGARLYEWMFPPALAERFAASLAKSPNLRLRLRLDPPEISRLPWELLYHPQLDFIATSIQTPLVRYSAQPFRARSIAAHSALRLLIASASPPDLPPLDSEREVESIATLLKQSRVADRITVTRLPHASRTQLQQALSAGADVWHYIGHGGLSDSGEGYLALEDQRVTAEVLSVLLRGRELSVAMLNGCETARSGDSAGALMGVAHALVRARVPTVIAMQAILPSETAHQMASALYGYLAERRPIDEAISEMRSDRFDGISAEWAIPVLFMRAEDGVIWKEERADDSDGVSSVHRGVTFSGISNSSISIGGSVVGGDLIQK